MKTLLFLFQRIKNSIQYRVKKKMQDIKESIYLRKLRKKGKNSNFTIISNNCWGGGVYEDLNMEYTTPTVGLFFYAPCYIEFLKNIPESLKGPDHFKEQSKYPCANEYRLNNNHFYPIGIIDDIEIHFLHYTSPAEALEKWNRRAKRVSLNNLYIKFCDRDLCTYEHMVEFDQLNFKNKVLFTARNYKGIKSLVWLEDYQDAPFIGDIYNNKWSYRKYFNVGDWLTSIRN